MKFLILRYRKVNSTQDKLKEVLELKGFKGNYVVTAEEQTEGRGRMGKNWFSPRGGLWFSFNYPLECMERERFLIKVCSDLLLTLREYVDDLWIKPPNDIVFKRKKLAGILTEVWKGFYITGIGVNINNTEHPELGISLYEITEKKYRVNEVLEKFLKNFNSNDIDLTFYRRNTRRITYEE